MEGHDSYIPYLRAMRVLPTSPAELESISSVHASMFPLMGARESKYLIL